MSQFILFTLKNAVQFSSELKIISIKDLKSNFNFIQDCANRLFEEEILKESVFTISNFDDICLSSQKEISLGKDIRETELYSILSLLRNNRIYLWYGSELDSLDKAFTFDDLIIFIKNSLRGSSCEIYIEYFPNY